MCRVHIALHIVQNMYYYTVFAPIQVSCFVNYLKQRAHDTLHMGKKMTTIKNYESHVCKILLLKKVVYVSHIMGPIKSSVCFLKT